MTSNLAGVLGDAHAYDRARLGNRAEAASERTSDLCGEFPKSKGASILEDSRLGASDFPDFNDVRTPNCMRSLKYSAFHHIREPI